MQLSQPELTAALTGAAKTVLASQRKDVRRGKVDVDTAWEEIEPYRRFQLLESLGEQLLPVLAALPEVPVPVGTRPSWTTAQVTDAVEGLFTEDVGRLRRRVLVRARVALVQAAVANLPPRPDPKWLDDLQR
ncbi:hypothetical protein [Rhodococcus sp. X156]|uniref:hypothetical protein n=1 Tax=Rhodococcus sp. X156 TaxID=2499145 RepID=UPI0019CFF76A|nr:hypothetical protein [Rhodococcus sp. X156]